jgi:hypothetical protein
VIMSRSQPRFSSPGLWSVMKPIGLVCGIDRSAHDFDCRPDLLFSVGGLGQYLASRYWTAQRLVLRVVSQGVPERSERRGAARSRGHGQGNLPSGHKRTMTKKAIAKIKTINHAGRKPRSTGKCCPQAAATAPCRREPPCISAGKPSMISLRFLRYRTLGSRKSFYHDPMGIGAPGLSRFPNAGVFFDPSLARWVECLSGHTSAVTWASKAFGVALIVPRSKHLGAI